MGRYDSEALKRAVFNDPERSTGIPGWGKTVGNKKTTAYRPDGSMSNKKDKTAIFLTEKGLSFSYFGSRFPERMNFYEFFAMKFNTTNYFEILERLGDMYRIAPDASRESEEERNRRQRRNSVASVIEGTAIFLSGKLNTDQGAVARGYLDGRGFKYGGDNAKYFGAYSRPIRSELVAHLRSKFPSATNIDGLVSEMLPFDGADYGLVIPYYCGGACKGFAGRLTSNADKPKYINTAGALLVKGGYYMNLAHGKPTIIVEGYFDAIRLLQEGAAEKYNIFALTSGSVPTRSDGAGEGEERDIIRRLETFGQKRIIYIPDVDIDGAGKRKTGLIHGIVKAFSAEVKGSDSSGFESFHIVDLADDSTIKKEDADTFIRKKGISVLFELIERKAVPSWEWELKTAVIECETQDELATRATEIYAGIKSEIVRERIRQTLNKKDRDYTATLKEAGFTTRYLTRIDKQRSSETSRETMIDARKKIVEAAESGQPLERIQRYVHDAIKIQGRNHDSQFFACADMSKSEMIGLIRKKRGYMETEWDLYDEKGNAVRKVGFPMSAVSTISAPTSHGKTRIMVQTAVNFARRRDGRYLYITLEQETHELTINAIKAFIGADWGKCQNPEEDIIAAARNDMPGDSGDVATNGVKRYFAEVFPYLKFVTSSNDVYAICTNVETLTEEWANEGVELGGVFIDHLQLLHAPGYNYSRTDEIKEISDELNLLAKRLHKPVICASQLNRNATKNNGDGIDGTGLANIGESTAIEQISHEAYIIWQTDRIPTDGNDMPATRAGRRTKRCLNDQGYIKPNRMYIESMKSRNYGIGLYALLRYTPNTGYINDKTEK